MDIRTAAAVDPEEIIVSTCNCAACWCEHDVESGLISEDFLEDHRSRFCQACLDANEDTN